MKDTFAGFWRKAVVLFSVQDRPVLFVSHWTLQF